VNNLYVGGITGWLINGEILPLAASVNSVTGALDNNWN
jgi:hypothetical protein